MITGSSSSCSSTSKYRAITSCTTVWTPLILQHSVFAALGFARLPDCEHPALFVQTGQRCLDLHCHGTGFSERVAFVNQWNEIFGAKATLSGRGRSDGQTFGAGVYRGQQCEDPQKSKDRARPQR